MKPASVCLSKAHCSFLSQSDKHPAQQPCSKMSFNCNFLWNEIICQTTKGALAVRRRWLSRGLCPDSRPSWTSPHTLYMGPLQRGAADWGSPLYPEPLDCLSDRDFIMFVSFNLVYKMLTLFCQTGAKTISLSSPLHLYFPVLRKEGKAWPHLMNICITTTPDTWSAICLWIYLQKRNWLSLNE